MRDYAAIREKAKEKGYRDICTAMCDACYNCLSYQKGECVYDADLQVNVLRGGKM